MSRHDAEDAGRPRGRGRRKGGGRRRSIGLIISGTLAGIVALALVGGSLVAYAKYRATWESIKHVDVTPDTRTIKNAPPVDPHAINILLIGSDSRAGENGRIGGHVGIGGQRSDTVMVLHIAPGAHRAVVLSFPRDSVVPIYSCTAEDGTTGQTAQPAEVEQINSTFAYGGPGCLWKTIELTTHIHINDFVELTFIGFEKVIDALHGVNVCLPEKVDDPMSGLDLRAGSQHIDGKQALAFWRTREDLGEGSDLQRIQRDQFLMASLLQGIEKSGLLTSVTKMASIIGTVARHLTTDADQSEILHIAESMRGLTSKSVQFIEVPVADYPANTAWVQWLPGDSQLFAAIAHDTKVPKTRKSTVGEHATLDTVSPGQVDVQILNGSGLGGVATTASAALTSRGFNVVGSTNAASFSYVHSVIEYSSAADLAAARTLQKQLADVKLVKDSSLTPGTVDLILGSSFSSLKPVSRSASTADLTKTYGGITGNTKICKDSSAFAGPG